jgi:hypothetical protein
MKMDYRVAFFYDRGRARLMRASVSLGMLLLTVVGCGDSRPLAPVHGQVLYNGKPLQFGGVTFQPPSGQPARATIGPDGKFTLTTPGEGEGGVIGTNQVRVTCYEGQSPDKKSAAGGEGVLGKSLIPEHYTSYETSGLTVEIKAGQTEPVILKLDDKSAAALRSRRLGP